MPTDAVISKSLVPPGGWRFDEGEYKLEAPTFFKLVELVGDHRRSNSKPVGDPDSEIMLQIGGKNPQLLLNKPVAVSPKFVEKIKSFAAALGAFIKGGGQLVDQNVANIRAETCRSCHNNSGEAAVLGCSPCQKTVELLRSGILHGRKTPSDAVLKSCALCGCDLRLKVWFPVKYFDPDGSQKNKYPSFCWIKGE